MNAFLTPSAGFYWIPRLWTYRGGFSVFWLHWILVVEH